MFLDKGIGKKNCPPQIRDYTGCLTAGQNRNWLSRFGVGAPAGNLRALPLKWLSNKEKLQVLEQSVLGQSDAKHSEETISPWNSPVFVRKKKTGK